MTTALLDGDIVAFRAAAANQEDIDWGDGLDGMTVSSKAAAETALRLARVWTKGAGADHAIVCFSSDNNWRREVLASYKANRTGEKPEAYWTAAAALAREFKTVTIPRLEADDVMGIIATKGRVPNPVIVTIDKDLQGIPGMIFNPIKDKRPRRITPKIADYWWMRQTLVGDVTDNYKGCPGVGPVNADKLLKPTGFDLNAMWRAVAKAFEDRGLTEDDALVQARVARILRATDIDNDYERISLWTPNRTSTSFISLTTDTTSCAPSLPKPSTARRTERGRSATPTEGRSTSNPLCGSGASSVLASPTDRRSRSSKRRPASTTKPRARNSSTPSLTSRRRSS